MYVSKHFEETQPEKLEALIRENPLATLVINGVDGLDANHIPLLFNKSIGEYGVLQGHIARANSLFRNSDTIQGDALAIFQGASSYISPSWYLAKQETGEVVPTWNYAVVHVYGSLRFIDNPDWLFRTLNELTMQSESSFATPWLIADAPTAYIQKLMMAIVGIEIEIVRMVGKWKTSQNKSSEERVSLASGLIQIGESSMADLMTTKD